MAAVTVEEGNSDSDGEEEEEVGLAVRTAVTSEVYRAKYCIPFQPARPPLLPQLARAGCTSRCSSSL